MSIEWTEYQNLTLVNYVINVLSENKIPEYGIRKYATIFDIPFEEVNKHWKNIESQYKQIIEKATDKEVELSTPVKVKFPTKDGIDDAIEFLKNKKSELKKDNYTVNLKKQVTELKEELQITQKKYDELFKLYTEATLVINKLKDTLS